MSVFENVTILHTFNHSKKGLPSKTLYNLYPAYFSNIFGWERTRRYSKITRYSSLVSLRRDSLFRSFKLDFELRNEYRDFALQSTISLFLSLTLKQKIILDAIMTMITFAPSLNILFCLTRTLSNIL